MRHHTPQNTAAAAKAAMAQTAPAPRFLAPPAAAPPPLRQYRFEFRGTTKEFYKIWLVNIALTLLTLGIFSAWAKVRTRKYFYSNTFLDGKPFAYHAKPLPILFSRLIVVGFIVTEIIVASQNLRLAVGYAALFALLAPLIIARGLAFDARNSSYRNVRFAFALGLGAYARIYAVFLPLIGLLFAEQLRLSGAPLVNFGAYDLPRQAQNALEFFVPWLLFLLLSRFAFRAYHAFKCRQYRWGSAQFGARPHPLRHYLLVSSYAMCMIVNITALLALSISISGAEFVVALLAPCVYLVFTVEMFSLHWSALELPGGGGVMFRGCFKKSCMSRKKYRVYRAKKSPRKKFVRSFAAHNIRNLAIFLLSLGLLYPWTRIRRARFLAKHVALRLPQGALDAHAKQAPAAVRKAGDTDFDIGLI